MNTKNNDALVLEIDELVAIGQKLSRDAAQSGRGLGPERIEELSTIASRGGQLIRRLYGHDSQYQENLKKVLATKNFSSMHSNWFEHVSELVGILKGIQHDIKSGMLSDFRRLLQARDICRFS